MLPNTPLLRLPLYAIVDIETTGSRPAEDRITEIAIVKHDGARILERFTTLVNPGRGIPYHITKLTGISNEMVAHAPPFYEVARQIVEFTEGCVFVAHNVVFDYTFLKRAFSELGYCYTRKTLCTVRLSRKLMPGHGSYALGRLCKSLGITLETHHRAEDDALAAAEIFDRLLRINNGGIAGEEGALQAQVEADMKREQTQSLLPPAITREMIKALPDVPGVYTFYGEHGKELYIGKSKCIRKRVTQHFQADVASNKHLDFKMGITRVGYELAGTDLVAQLMECDAIKRIRPPYNKALRKTLFHTGIYEVFDEKGYATLVVKKLKDMPNQQPIIALTSALHARNILAKRCKEYVLCQKLCDLYKARGGMF